MKQLRLLSLVAALSLLFIPAVGGVASAAPPLIHTAANGIAYQTQLTPKFHFCNIYIAPVQPGQTKSQSDTACFTSDAERAATSQHDLGIVSPVRTKAVGSPDVCYTSGIIADTYNGQGYSGYDQDWWSYNCWEPICSDGSRFLYGQVPSNVNDAISSVKTYGGCETHLWADQNFGNGPWTCNPNCYSVGYMDNQASSISFVPSGE